MTWPPDGQVQRAAGWPVGGGGQRSAGEEGSDATPPTPPRPPASIPRRLVTAAAGLLSLVLLLISGGGWLALRYYDGKVTHVPVVFPAADRRPAGAAGETQNILLVGSDSRAGTAGEFGEVEGQRSDTTILAHLDANGSTTLASFPRDLWVTIPAYTDSAGHKHTAGRSKLNAAFALGGPSLLIRTIEELTKIRIDHYLQIDFVGFQRMTDALGGVTVCVRPLPNGSRTNLDDKMSGWHGHVGDNMLNGEQALAFVRQRYGLPEADLDRIRRQQQFIGVIFRAATSTSTLANPVRLASLMDAVTSSISVGDDTSLADLAPLAVRLRGVGTGGVRLATVPASPGQIGGQSVLLTDPGKLASFVAGLSGGQPSASVHATVSGTGTGAGAGAAPVSAGAAPDTAAVVLAAATIRAAATPTAASRASGTATPALVQPAGSCTY
ncbi:LCP family protein [Frankia sp. Cj3]|uniref:LCP family protein n=1 Tax=Frankia sp. Cj3 TaxID=2880976 RepID=UPI001EF5EA9F|nr:LCP family protein [Frankia sp. Cj3]